ncbi:hypothetical protein HY623_00295 [Candidatus Uhrbacteria bacterium]|nr:hypothetical protein [Candidatus Uhrbacteria bacterium]
MKESSIKGPFQPVDSGIFIDETAEAAPRRVRRSIDQKQGGEPAQPSVPPDTEETELLPGEEEYARLMTIHLKEPKPFPKNTEELRASMFPKLEELNKQIRPEDKRLSDKIEFYPKAKKLFTSNDDPLHDDALITYADQLYRTYLRGHSLREAIYNIFLLLNIHNTIAISIGKVPKIRVQMLGSAIADSLLIHHDITPEQLSEIDTIMRGVGGVLGEGFKEIVRNRIGDYVKVRSYAEQLRGKLAEHHESLSTLQPELQQMSGEFMEQIRSLRKYGIKSSYYQDGFLHADADAWVITDINDIISGSQSRRGIVALISLSNREDLVKAGELRYDLKTDAVSRRYESSYPAGAPFFLKWDGELYDNAPDRHLSAQEIFQRVGAEIEYEIVRASFLARIHDLVVPLELTRTLPPIDDLGQAFSQRSGEGRDPEDIATVIRKIFLPRIRLHADDRVRKLLDDDVAQRSHSVREHDVTAFTRELPVGCHPSPQAVALAREYNFILDPQGNRTFVRPHTRGTGGAGFIYEQKDTS